MYLYNFVHNIIVMIPQQSTKMVESHIVEAHNSTPVKQQYIHLSPHRKSRRTLGNEAHQGLDKKI